MNVPLLVPRSEHRCGYLRSPTHWHQTAIGRMKVALCERSWSRGQSPATFRGRHPLPVQQTSLTVPDEQRRLLGDGRVPVAIDDGARVLMAGAGMGDGGEDEP